MSFARETACPRRQPAALRQLGEKRLGQGYRAGDRTAAAVDEHGEGDLDGAGPPGAGEPGMGLGRCGGTEVRRAGLAADRARQRVQRVAGGAVHGDDVAHDLVQLTRHARRLGRAVDGGSTGHQRRHHRRPGGRRPGHLGHEQRADQHLALAVGVGRLLVRRRRYRQRARVCADRQGRPVRAEAQGCSRRLERGRRQAQPQPGRRRVAGERERRGERDRALAEVVLVADGLPVDRDGARARRRAGRGEPGVRGERRGVHGDLERRPRRELTHQGYVVGGRARVGRGQDLARGRLQHHDRGGLLHRLQHRFGCGLVRAVEAQRDGSPGDGRGDVGQLDPGRAGGVRGRIHRQPWRAGQLRVEGTLQPREPGLVAGDDGALGPVDDLFRGRADLAQQRLGEAARGAEQLGPGGELRPGQGVDLRLDLQVVRAAQRDDRRGLPLGRQATPLQALRTVKQNTMQEMRRFEREFGLQS